MSLDCSLWLEGLLRNAFNWWKVCHSTEVLQRLSISCFSAVLVDMTKATTQSPQTSSHYHPFDHCQYTSAAPPASTAPCNPNRAASRPSIPSQETQSPEARSLLNIRCWYTPGIQNLVTRDSVQQTVWVLERLIARKNTAELLSTTHPCTGSGERWNGVVRNSTKPPCTRWGCHSLLQTQAAVSVKASGLGAEHCASSQPSDRPTQELSMYRLGMGSLKEKGKNQPHFFFLSNFWCSDSFVKADDMISSEERYENMPYLPLEAEIGN